MSTSREEDVPKYQDKFHELWRMLEDGAASDEVDKFDAAILRVFEELGKLKCSCILAAPGLFTGVLGQPSLTPPSTAGLTKRGRLALVQHIHNLVNMKLNKPIYKKPLL